MPSTTRDTTWQVTDAQGNIFVELDIRLFADYNFPSDDPCITDAKALFRKHDKLQEFDLPDNLRLQCIAQLQADAELMSKWVEQIAEEEREYRQDQKGGF